MPELKNEIPTQEELWVYFLEHCPWMAAPNKPTFVDDPQIVEAQTRYGCLEFHAKLGQVMWEALNGLNALDRSHPLWRNTNRRPTVYKLDQYARMRLAADATDEQALWTLAALDSWFGSNNFGEVYWKRLWELGRLDIRWPIRAGLWHEMMLNFGGGFLADLLIEMAAQQEAQPILEDLAQANDAGIRDWAHEVMVLLSESRA